MPDTLPLRQDESDELWSAAGAPPGAAGSTVLEIPAGALEVDVLTGSIAAIDVQAIAIADAPRWFAARVDDDERVLVVDDELERLARVAQLSALVETMALDLVAPAAVVVAQLELADLAIGLDPDFGLGDMTDEWLDAATATATVIDVGGLDNAAPETAIRALLNLCDRLLAVRSDRDDLRSLRAEILGVQPDRALLDELVLVGVGAYAPSIGPDSEEEHGPLLGSPPDPIVEITGPSPVVDARAWWDGEDLVVSVTLPATADGVLWAEVMNGGEVVASIGVDVVGGFGERRLALRGRATVVGFGPNPFARSDVVPGVLLDAARAAGRRATALGLAGFDRPAVDTWAECAHAWLTLPDGDRAGLAAMQAAAHSADAARSEWRARAHQWAWGWARPTLLAVPAQPTFVWPSFLAAPGVVRGGAS